MERMNIMVFRAAVMAGFTAAVRGLRHTKSSDWWEYVVRGTFDD